MSEKRWETVSELFERAAALSPAERAPFLERACGDDPELLAEILSLLEHDSGETGSVSDAIDRATADALVDSGPHDIRGYRVLHRIGLGGMGEVWEAEQTSPVRRRVAVKIIKRGMDTDRIVARFEAERQALALMSHPNVARVFDAGTTEGGQPFFAMEHVEGVPITRHCDAGRLGIGERLRLFQQVCAGVQHAHQKGIIHRDIKPSNVLVQTEDGRGVPKIIDFGVAKATRQRLTERTLFTEAGQLIGTPEYMSPEQAELTGEDIDTRSDVYSLGVLLYELLAGALPFDSEELRRAGFDEIRRRIREDEPSRPSARVAAAGRDSAESADRRRTDVSSLRRRLAGDLDWMVMRALEKDRARRYASPSELAADIERHLSDEPVTAGPPSTVYRMGKFVRRHRFAVAGALLSAVVLVAFTLVTTVQSRKIAREAQARVRVSEFLGEMIGNLDPQTIGASIWTDLLEQTAAFQRERGATEEQIELAETALMDALVFANPTDVANQLLDEQILSPAGRTIEQELANEPEIAGRLHHTVGEAYLDLSMHEQAGQHSRRAVEILRRELGRDHASALESSNTLAWVRMEQGSHDESEELFLDTLKRRRKTLGDDHRDALTSMYGLANLYRLEGRLDESESTLRDVLERQVRVLGREDRETLNTMNDLALLLANQGKLEESEERRVELLEIQRKTFGEDDPDVLTSRANLALLYTSQGRYDKAEPIHLRTIADQKRILGEDHVKTMMSMNNLAGMYFYQGLHDEAEKIWAEVLPKSQRLLGSAHATTLGIMSNLASSRARLGRHGDAEPLFVRALDLMERTLGPDDLTTLLTMGSLGDLYVTMGQADRGEPLLARAVDGLNSGYPGQYFTGLTIRKHGACLTELRRFAEAETALVRAHEILVATLGEENPRTLEAVEDLLKLYEIWGKPEAARGFLDREAP